MGHASLKISQEAKLQLALLQAELLIDFGERVTQGKLVERLIALGRRERLRLLDWTPLTPAEWEKALELVVHTGDSRGEEHIDEDLNRRPA